MLPPSLQSSIYTRLGPGSLSGLIFADMCDQLLIQESASCNASFSSPSDRAGDFLGLDSFVETGPGLTFEGFTGRTGFQYKFFGSESVPLTAAHKREVEASIKAARDGDSRDGKLVLWILVTPEDLNKHQHEWLTGLREKLKCKFEVAHWGQKRLSSLIAKYPECAVHIYPESHTIKPLSFRDMCGRLSSSLREIAAHSEYHIDIPLRHHVPVDGALWDFATDSHSTLFCLLGGYGTGKTVALEHLTLGMATKYMRGEVARIPLLVRLRHVRGSGAFSHNLVAYIDREFGIDVDVTTLKRLIAAGRVLLIFDGLDEKELSVFVTIVFLALYVTTLVLVLVFLPRDE
jgi:hypothetical protein